jgi:hypothetical protein
MSDSVAAVNPVSKRRGGVPLACCGVVMLVLWLAVLPWLAQTPAMSRHLRWLNEHNINPGAMYYTELESMGPILRRLNEGESILEGSRR